MIIGDRIKQRRKELGLTQTELAHRMGITSKTTICKAETTNFNPTTDRVREFAKALETSPAFLMGWVENPDPQYNPRKFDDESNPIYPEDEVVLSDDDRLELQVKMLIKKYGSKLLKDMIKIIPLYEQASPEVRDKIALLLKPTKSDL